MTFSCISKKEAETYDSMAEVASAWISVREYKRRHEGSNAVSKWDEDTKTIGDMVYGLGDAEPTEELGNAVKAWVASAGADAEAFAKQMDGVFVGKGAWVKLDYGEVCIDWSMWACACAYAANLAATARQAWLDQCTGGACDFYCDKSVMDDPGYTSFAPGPFEKKTNWTPWLVGGGVAAGLVALGIVMASED